MLMIGLLACYVRSPGFPKATAGRNREGWASEVVPVDVAHFYGERSVDTATRIVKPQNGAA